MNSIKIVLIAIAVLAVILFRKSIRRIYQATVQPVVRKSVEAFRVGL